MTWYMCLTDYTEELGVASRGVRLYESLDILLNSGRTCFKECGIAVVKVVDADTSDIEFDQCENVIYPKRNATISATPVKVIQLAELHFAGQEWVRTARPS